jgi:hypothetical protein
MEWKWGRSEKETIVRNYEISPQNVCRSIETVMKSRGMRNAVNVACPDEKRSSTANIWGEIAMKQCQRTRM